MSLSEDMFDEYVLEDAGHTNWLVAPMVVLDPHDLEAAFDDDIEFIQHELGDFGGENCSVLIWEKTVVFAVCAETGRAIRSVAEGWLPCPVPSLASGRC